MLSDSSFVPCSNDPGYLQLLEWTKSWLEYVPTVHEVLMRRYSAKNERFSVQQSLVFDTSLMLTRDWRGRYRIGFFGDTYFASFETYDLAIACVFVLFAKNLNLAYPIDAVILSEIDLVVASMQPRKLTSLPKSLLNETQTYLQKAKKLWS